MGLIFNGNGDVIRAVDGSLTIQGQDFDGGGNINAGIVTGTSANFTGAVSVGGVLTYEDVKNVDSVGVVTARAGVNISGGNLQVGGTNVLNSGLALYNVDSIKLADTKELKLGSSDDLKLWHNSHSYIRTTNTGQNLYLQTTDGQVIIGEDGGHIGLVYNVGSSVVLRHNNNSKFETTAAGANLTGELNLSGELNFTGNGHKYIDVATLNGGHSLSIRHQDGSSYETGLTLDANGAAKLFHNNSKKFETASWGVDITGDCRASELKLEDDDYLTAGSGNDLRLRHNGTDSTIDNATGDLYMRNSAGQILIRAETNCFISNYAASEHRAAFYNNAQVELYHNGSKKFETTSTGASISGLLAVSGSTSETSTFTGNGVTIAHASGSNIFIGTQTGTDAKIQVTNNADLHFRTNNTERLRIDSSGRVTIKNGGSDLASAFNGGANQFVITHNASCGLTIDSTSSTSSSIHFADGATGGESYRGIIEYQHSVDDMKFAVESTHIARLRKGSHSDVNGGMIIGNSADASGSAHSDSRTLILGGTTHGETGMSFLNSTSGHGKIRFSDGTSPYNQGTISYFHGTRTVGEISSYPESFSIASAQKDDQLVLNGNEAMRLSSGNSKHKMVDGFFEKSINTSFSTVFTIRSGSANSSPHYGYFYEIIVFGGDWGSHSANRVYFKGFINGYNGYGGHSVIEHSGTFGSNTGGQGHYGSDECQIQVVFGSNGDSEIQMRLNTGGVTATGYARFIGYIRDYDGFNIR